MENESRPTGRCPAVFAHACAACGIVSVWQGEHIICEAAPAIGAELGQAPCPACGYAGAETVVAWGREIRGRLKP
jgi:Na+-translocating ferredoxin:NAD+ oxidoreductase RNF subunit RnfB